MADPATRFVVWVARCGVCSASYEQEARGKPSAAFCPECQESRRRAPGVLNWQPDLAEVRNGR